MQRGVHTNIPRPIIAQSIWDGLAIMGTDGSVKDDTATFSWIISTTNDTINPDVTGGGLLPPPATYTDHYSKRPEAAALFAGLSWIHDLLHQHPDTNPSSGSTPSLPIPIDSKSVLDDITRPVTNSTPTYHLLHPDYDIIQAIRTLIDSFPIPLDIFHVKSHQDRTKPYDELTPFAQINIHADHHADAIHDMPPSTTGLFPTWIPGTKAALFRHTRQITKSLPAYIRTATHTPIMRHYLIQRSQEATGRDAPWDDTVFDTIAWKHLGEAFNKLAIGQRIQLSKYMNDQLPTLARLSKYDNRVNNRCFECGFLGETTNHVLCCSGEHRSSARDSAMETFRQHLERQQTPFFMIDLICDSLDSWLQRSRITPPTWQPPEDPIEIALSQAFASQRRIGWDQFLRGRLAIDWKHAIHLHYCDTRPGESFNADHWLRTTIDAIWKFAMTLWRQRCATYHGENGALTKEQQRKHTAQEATAVYQATIGHVLPSDSLVLHRAKIADILNWTKQHLDAYLATAEVICEQNVEPG
jgi:hypothetical protein